MRQSYKLRPTTKPPGVELLPPGIVVAWVAGGVVGDYRDAAQVVRVQVSEGVGEGWLVQVRLRRG